MTSTPKFCSNCGETLNLDEEIKKCSKCGIDQQQVGSTMQNRPNVDQLPTKVHGQQHSLHLSEEYLLY